MRTFVAIVTVSLMLGLISRPGPASQDSENISPLGYIQMMDAQTGWAMTALCGPPPMMPGPPCPPHVISRQLLHTTNGGVEWKDVRPVDSSGRKVEIVGLVAYSNTAWTQRTDLVYPPLKRRELFRTSDSGRTWKSIAIPPVAGVDSDPPFSGFSFINAREGWLLVSLGGAMGPSEGVAVFRSTDGGDTWTAMAIATNDFQTYRASGMEFGGYKKGIIFLDSATGWIPVEYHGSEGPILYVTRDGGRTWRKQELPNPPQVRRDHFPNPPSPNYTPGLPRFFTSQDGIVRVVCYQDDRWLVVFYVTHDGGVTWKPTTPVFVKQALPLEPNDFVSMRRGWVKHENTLYTTNDGGVSWSRIRPSQLFADVTQLNFVSPEVGWAIRNTLPMGGGPTGGGAEQTPPFLLKTLDGGRTWTPVTYSISRQ